MLRLLRIWPSLGGSCASLESLDLTVLSNPAAPPCPYLISVNDTVIGMLITFLDWIYVLSGSYLVGRRKGGDVRERCPARALMHVVPVARKWNRNIKVHFKNTTTGGMMAEPFSPYPRTDFIEDKCAHHYNFAYFPWCRLTTRIRQLIALARRVYIFAYRSVKRV